MKFKTNLLVILSLVVGLIPSASVQAFKGHDGKELKFKRAKQFSKNQKNNQYGESGGKNKKMSSDDVEKQRQEEARQQKGQEQTIAQKQKTQKKTEEKTLWSDGILGAYVVPAIDNATKLDVSIENTELLPQNSFTGKITVGAAKKIALAGVASIIGLGIAAKVAESSGMNKGINNYFENSGSALHSLALAGGTAAVAVPLLGYKSLSRNIAVKFNTLCTFNKIASWMPDVSGKVPMVVKGVYNSTPGKIAAWPFEKLYGLSKFMAKNVVNSLIEGIIGCVPGMP